MSSTGHTFSPAGAVAAVGSIGSSASASADGVLASGSARAGYAAAPLSKHKVVFVGDQGSGKTSIIKAFIYGSFDYNYQVSRADRSALLGSGSGRSGTVGQCRHGGQGSDSDRGTAEAARLNLVAQQARPLMPPSVGRSYCPQPAAGPTRR